MKKKARQLKRQKISRKRGERARKKRKEFEKLKNIGYFEREMALRPQKKPRVSLGKRIKFWLVLIWITIYQVYLKVKKTIKKLKNNETKI